jgi:hypothetical protein
MVGLAVCDLRRGISILPDGFDSPPVSIPTAAGFGLPYGLSRLPDGRLLTADQKHSRIIAVAEDGSNWESFGALGNGIGQFNQPMGVTVSEEGRIFVADTGNYRIVALDSMTGGGWQAYGRKTTAGDTGAGTFAWPIDVRHGPDGLVVADPRAARVVKLAQLADAWWDASPQGAFANPVTVGVLSDGTIVVGELAREGLSLMATPSSGVSGNIADPLLRFPSAIAVGDADEIMVCCLPTLALCSVVRGAAGWNVSLATRLDGLGLRRPTALYRLP